MNKVGLKTYRWRTILMVTALVVAVAVIFYIIGFLSAFYLPQDSCESSPISTPLPIVTSIAELPTIVTPKATFETTTIESSPISTPLPIVTSIAELPTTVTPKATFETTTIGLPTISIKYTVENVVTMDDNVFRATIKYNTTKQPFIDIMNEIQQIDQEFRFTSSQHATFGHFVTHVQDVGPEADSNMYWAFLRREASGDCSLPVGVSSYVPSDGEHLVFSLQKMSLQLEQCTDFIKQPPTEATTTFINISSSLEKEKISMEYTLENKIMDDDNNFELTATIITPVKFFYEIMRDVMLKDDRFSFNTSHTASLGHYITSVRSLSANHTNRVYWAFLRRQHDADCSMAIGISTYLPSDGEHLVISFQTYDSAFKSCESLRKKIN